MKFIKPGLLFLLLALTTASLFADDINIFLRNRWDNVISEEGKKGQVLFLLDLVSAESGTCNTAWEDVDLTEPCVSGNCKTITVSAGEHGTIAPTPTWAVEAGNPGLFLITPEEGYKVNTVTGSCGGTLYDGNFFLTSPVTDNCTVDVTFMLGEETFDCVPGETSGEPVEGKYPPTRAECIAVGGFWSDPAVTGDRGSIVFSNHYPAYGNANRLEFTGCMLPSAGPGSGGEGGEICLPPVFQRRTCPAASVLADYRPSIEAIMRARPDIKYGIYALTETGAHQVFPLEERDDDELEAAIALLNSSDVNVFPKITGEKFPTLSALEEIYNYLSGADTPLTNDCLTTQFVMFASGGFSGDDAHFSDTFALKTKVNEYLTAKGSPVPVTYAQLLVGIAEYLNNESANEDFNIATDIESRVRMHIVAVNPDSSQVLFNTSPAVAKQMTDASKGFYTPLTLGAGPDANRLLGESIVSSVLRVLDYAYDTPTTLTTPVAPASLSRGYHLDDFIVSAFEPAINSAWQGNLHRTTQENLATQQATDFATYSTFSFPATRSIYTNACASGEICPLTTDSGLTEEQIAWLNSGFGTETNQALLGDVLHFRPLPINYGDDIGTYYVVGTNRGLLHMFDENNVEKWAFLPAQLINTVRALHGGKATPSYMMANKFYGVDGQPTVFIYDHDKNGEITPDENDRVILSYGLRRGGAGYYSMDITNPDTMPDILITIGGSEIAYAPTIESIPIFDGSGEPIIEENSEPGAIEPSQGYGDGGCSQFYTTNGSLITGGVVSQQCPLATKLGGGNCGRTYNDLCLQYSCDYVSSITASHGVLESAPVGSFVGYAPDGQPIFSSKKSPACYPTMTCRGGSATFTPNANTHYSAISGAAGCFAGAAADNQGSSGAKAHLAIGKTLSGESSAIIGFDINGLPPNIQIKKATLSVAHTGSTVLSNVAPAAVYSSGVNVYASSKGCYGNHPYEEGSPGNTALDCTDTNHTLLGRLSDPGSYGYGARAYITITDAPTLNNIFIKNTKIITKKGSDIVWNGSQFVRVGTFTDTYTWVQFKLSRVETGTSGLLAFAALREGETIADQTAAKMKGWEDYFNTMTPKLHLEWDCLEVTEERLLEVAIEGTLVDEGQVTSSPAGIDCHTKKNAADPDPVCSKMFVKDDVVTLSATPTASFTQWGGTDACAVPTNPVCSMTMSQARSIKAIFGQVVPISWRLDLTVEGSGTVTSNIGTIKCGTGGTQCQNLYANDETIVLTATPDPDRAFIGFTGCTSTSGNTCTVKMSSDIWVVAEFQREPGHYDLTVEKRGEGDVFGTGDATIDCGTTCVATGIPENGVVTFSYAAKKGHQFSGWGGACAGTGACVVAFDANKTVVAYFEPEFVCQDNSATMASHVTAGRASASGSCNSWSSSCNWTVVGSGDTISLPYAQRNNLQSIAQTQPGYYRKGSCVDFLPSQYELTVNKAGTGTGTVTSSPAAINCGDTCSAMFDPDTVVNLTATPTAGVSLFAGWSGGCTGTGGCSVTMDGARSVTATFNTIQYEVTASVDGGHGTVSPASQMVNINESTYFTLTPEAGYVIDEDNTGGCGSLVDNRFVTGVITANCAVVIAFKQSESDFYTVTATAGANGSVSPASQLIEIGTTTQVNITPAAAYVIDSITSTCGGGSLTGNVYTTAPITTNCSVAVTFKAKPVVCSSNTNSCSNHISANRLGSRSAFSFFSYVTYGTDRLGSDACSGYDNTTIYCPAVGGLCYKNLSDCEAGHDIPPVFYTVSTDAGPHGTFSPTNRTVANGSVTSFTIESAEGYQVASASGCGGSLSGNTYTTGAISGNCLITANMALKSYTVTTVAGTGGTISPTNPSVNHFATTTLTVAPSYGYQIAGVSGCGGTLSGTTFTTGVITGACTVNATFSKLSYTVSASVTGTGGAIVPDTRTVEYLDTTTFELTPSEGYEINAVSGCGGVLSGTTYTTAAITENCAVTAQFSLKNYTVSAVAGTGGTVDNASKTVDHGGTASFVFTPNTGYQLIGVTGCDGSLATNTYTTGPITAACTVTAEFGKLGYTVTATAGANGTIAPDTRTVEFEATTTFTVTPNTGYEIDTVTGCGTGSLVDSVYTTAPITGDCTVAATFTSRHWNVTAQVASGNGTILPATRSVSHGLTTTFTVTAATGYAIQSVAGCGGTFSGATFTTGPITGECTVNAMFSKLSYTVTATAGANGAVTPATQSVEYQNNAQVQITPDTNYQVASVGGTCGGALSDNTYVTSAVTTNCTVTVTFEVIPTPPETLTVTKAGAGAGTSTVSSNPSGISCGSTCSYDFEAGTVVTLTASAGSGNSFTGWSGAGCSGTGTCVVTMSEARSVTATFNPSWANCASQITGTCQAQVDAGRLYKKTDSNKTPADGANVNNPAGCTRYYMTGSAPVYCRTSGELCYFSQSTCLGGIPTQRTVTGSVSGSGGTISPASQTVANGTTAQLVVTPSVGYEINTVTGCGGSMTGSTTYTTGSVTANCAVTATFSLKNHTVTTTAGTGGTISPSNPSVGHGMTQAFTITPATGYEIGSVTGCGGSLSGSTYTTAAITGPCGVIANFNESIFTVSTSAGANGSISPSSQTGRYGEVRSFTISPNTNYEIASVSGCGGSLSGNTYTTAALTGSCTVSATFSILKYTVSGSAGSGGSISPASQQVNHGSSATLTLSPATGYSIDSVSGCGGSLSGSTYTTGAITGACTVTATFSLNNYTVSTSAGANGSISPTSRAVDHGDTTTFTIVPAANYDIDAVSGCGGSLSGTTYTTGTITGACTVTASYKIKTYAVTASAGTGGSIAPVSVTVNHGATTSFILSTDTGYSIDTVSGCGGTLSGSTFTTGPITGACSITASFSLNNYTVSTVAGANGSITPTSRAVSHGGTTTFGISPATNYDIDSVSGCGGSLSGTTYTTGSITGACTVTASFKIKTYLVSTNAGSGGTISPASRTIDHGATTTFTITPATGYQIDSVSGCGGSLSGSTWTTGAITAACTVSATFSKQSYTVSATAGANGTISPSSRSVQYQDTTTFTVTPSTGYDIDAVTGCGGSLSGSTYTTGAISGACTVNATFKIKTYLVSTSAGTGGSIAPVSQTVNHGATTTFTATPDTGYQVASITGCSGTRSGNSYTTGTITSACTVTATFSKLGYTVAASGNAGGTVSPASQTVLYQETTTVTITPNVGYSVSVGGTCGGSLVGTTYTTNAITGNCTVVATFTINTYTVTASAGANGTIAPSSQSVTHGSTTTFTVTPNTGYSATVGGTCGGSLSGTTYTTNAITGNCTVSATFSKLSYTVTASTNAGGTIAPASQTVLYQDTTTFTVTPNAGYSVSMGGTCGGSLSGTTYTTSAITGNCTVVATFTINSYAVTASATGNGTITPASQSITHGATAAFTVTPDTGHEVSMGGTCGGLLSGNTYTTFGITAACTVTATFTPINYTVTASGSAGGTITPATRTAAYNTATTFTVTPNAGYSVSMGGTCGGSLSGTTYTTNAITGNCTVTATFTINSYTVTASGNAGGTITPPTQAVTHGSTTTFTVTPNTGYSVSVGGTCGGSLSGTTYTTSAITGNCTVVATFTLNTYTVSASATGNGTITPATRTVNHGSTTTFTVTPNTGHTVSMGGTCGGSLSGTTYTTGAVTGACTVTATFTPISYTVTASAGSGGSISPTSQTVAYGSTTTFTVTPNTGYTASVGGTCGGSLSGTTYTTSAIAGNCTVVATFTLNTYTVSASATGNGTISPATRTVNHGATTTFTVTPNAGHEATMGGTCGGSLSGTTYTTGAVTGACTVTATFTPISYTVTASAGSGGSISPPSRSVAYGSTTTFTVTPNAGYTASVGGTCGGSLSGTTYTTNAITGACTVTASFTLNSYTVSASASGNGSISPATRTVNHGSTTTFTVTPNTGHEVTMGGTCGGSLSGTTYTTGAVTGACTVTATFTPINYTVTASAGSGGSISPTSRSVAYGSTTTFTVTPNAGYTASVGGTCGGSLSGTTYTTNAITGACTVTASFTINSYTVTASAGSNGSITPSGGQLVNHGSTTTFTVTANSGYVISSVAGTCGGSLSGTIYTTSAITGNCTVVASFVVNNVTLSVTKTGTGTGTVTGNGINCGAVCTMQLSPTTNVTLTATTPAVISTTVTDGYMYKTTRDQYSTFAGWSGGCTGTGNCVMNPLGSAKTVTAKFDVCIRTSVYRHYAEGRTVSKVSFYTTGYYAKGSETFLANQGTGTYTTYFSLRETSSGYWEVVASCN